MKKLVAEVCFWGGIWEEARIRRRSNGFFSRFCYEMQNGGEH